MPCYEIVEGDNVVGHICRSSGETKPAPHRRKKRLWCFACRKRLLHTRMMFEPGPESYYEPNFWWQCPNCNEDHTTFPGY